MTTDPEPSQSQQSQQQQLALQELQEAAEQYEQTRSVIYDFSRTIICKICNALPPHFAYISKTGEFKIVDKKLYIFDQQEDNYYEIYRFDADEQLTILQTLPQFIQELTDYLKAENVRLRARLEEVRQLYPQQ